MSSKKGIVKNNKALTALEYNNVYSYVQEIIENLDPSTLSEISDGYDGDFHKLLDDIFIETYNIIKNNGKYLGLLDGFSLFENHFDEQMRILSYNYFKSTCLPNFNQGWRNLEFGSLAQLHPWLCVLAHRGSGKCFLKGTRVLMYDGSIKNIEDIKVGDLVMGKNNTSRKVLKTHSGVDDMYEVEQKMFNNYIVNSKHDIYLKKWTSKYDKVKKRNVRIYDELLSEEYIMTPKDYINKSDSFKRDTYGIGVNGWDLSEKKLLIEPYFLGIWLGDGYKCRPEIASVDKEVIDYFYDYSKRLGLDVLHLELSITYRMTAPDWIKPKMEGINVMLNRMRHYNLIENKHIPEIYFIGSRKQRLELLAGLIDSDGHNPKDKKNSIVFTQKNVEFVKQVQRLCWSLGFRANYTENTYKTKAKKDGIATTVQLHISGDMSQVPCKIERKKTIHKYTENKNPQRRGINVKYYGKGEYYGFTCDKDHLFVLEDGTIVKNSHEWCFAYPTWKLYRYRKPSLSYKDTIDNKNSKDTVIITNEKRLGRLHLEKIHNEILDNDILREKLIGDNSTRDIGKDKIVCPANKATVDLRSFGSFIRGLHVGTVIIDDFLDKSVLYSLDQRNKFSEVFEAEIKSIVEPFGNLIVSGTPFVQGDLYDKLKKDPMFKVFEYPAIYPDGTLLAEDRFTFEHLMNIKESIGSLIFSREYLVKPITDGASIFPWEYLKKSFVGMENTSLCTNISLFPIKLERVVVGCDFAISGNIGADYTVYTVWGRDNMKNYYLLHVWRKQGASHNEQVNKIVELDNNFKPNKIIAEKNGFQQILIELVKERGIQNIEPFQTTGFNKKDYKEGLPSLAVLFERGEIKIPYKADGSTRETAEWLCGEFNSITFDPDRGKLESVSEHDDGAMSCFFAISDLRDNETEFKFHSF